MSGIKFNIKYIVCFIVLFIAEVYIALFVHDKIIRPYIGDLLVIILLYSFVRSFTNKIKFLPLYLFVFAFIVEVAQYINILSILGLEKNKTVAIVVGSSFDIADIGCYLFGSIILIVYEKILKRGCCPN